MGLARISSVLALGGAALFCAKMAVADPATASRAAAPQGPTAYRAVDDELSLSDASLAAGAASGHGSLLDLSGSSCQGYQEIRHQVTELRTAGGAQLMISAGHLRNRGRQWIRLRFRIQSGGGGAQKRERKGQEDERVRVGGDGWIGQKPRRRSWRPQRLVPRGVSATNAGGRA